MKKWSVVTATVLFFVAVAVLVTAQELGVWVRPLAENITVSQNIVQIGGGTGAGNCSGTNCNLGAGNLTGTHHNITVQREHANASVHVGEGSFPAWTFNGEWGVAVTPSSAQSAWSRIFAYQTAADVILGSDDAASNEQFFQLLTQSAATTLNALNDDGTNKNTFLTLDHDSGNIDTDFNITSTERIEGALLGVNGQSIDDWGDVNGSSFDEGDLPNYLAHLNGTQTFSSEKIFQEIYVDSRLSIGNYNGISSIYAKNNLPWVFGNNLSGAWYGFTPISKRFLIHADDGNYLDIESDRIDTNSGIVVGDDDGVIINRSYINLTDAPLAGANSYELGGETITAWSDLNGTDGVGTNCNGTTCTTINLTGEFFRVGPDDFYVNTTHSYPRIGIETINPIESLHIGPVPSQTWPFSSNSRGLVVSNDNIGGRSHLVLDAPNVRVLYMSHTGSANSKIIENLIVNSRYEWRLKYDNSTKKSTPMYIDMVLDSVHFDSLVKTQQAENNVTSTNIMNISGKVFNSTDDINKSHADTMWLNGSQTVTGLKTYDVANDPGSHVFQSYYTFSGGAPAIAIGKYLSVIPVIQALNNNDLCFGNDDISSRACLYNNGETAFVGANKGVTMYYNSGLHLDVIDTGVYFPTKIMGSLNRTNISLNGIRTSDKLTMSDQTGICNDAGDCAGEWFNKTWITPHRVTNQSGSRNYNVEYVNGYDSDIRVKVVNKCITKAEGEVAYVTLYVDNEIRDMSGMAAMGYTSESSHGIYDDVEALVNRNSTYSANTTLVDAGECLIQQWLEEDGYGG